MSKSIKHLLEIMAALRDPEQGCPWDQKQSFATIAPYTLEEAYEVVDAIAREDMGDLQDELGDLLFQVVYHAQMAAELKHFEFDDVVMAICNKMVRRHPHVFADQDDINAANLASHWEQFKQQERAHKNTTANDESVLAGVSKGLPSLLRARKLQKKAALVNFDWSAVEPVLHKVDEELSELRAAISEQQDQARIEEELGDVLFSIVNVSRHLKLDADIALQKANAKFEKRFRAMEQQLNQQNQDFSSMTESALEDAWQNVKKLEHE